MSNENFHQPSNDIRDSMQETARAIEARLPPGSGYILFAFDFTRPEYEGRSALEYLSNAKREDVVKLLKEFIEACDHPDRWMKHQGDGPAAPGIVFPA